MIGCRPFALMIFRHYRGLKKNYLFQIYENILNALLCNSPAIQFTHQLQISSAFGILQLN